MLQVILLSLIYYVRLIFGFLDVKFLLFGGFSEKSLNLHLEFCHKPRKRLLHE